MPLKYTDDQRREYLALTERVGSQWLAMFEGNPEFYSAAYWDLLSGMWRAAAALRKTDALGLMHGVKSAHTGGKYLEGAIARGLVVETGNPDDARSKLVELAPDMRRKLDAFFDAAVAEMGKSAAAVAAKKR